MSGTQPEEDKKPGGDQSAHINLKVKGQVTPEWHVRGLHRRNGRGPMKRLVDEDFLKRQENENFLHVGIPEHCRRGHRVVGVDSTFRRPATAAFCRWVDQL